MDDANARSPALDPRDRLDSWKEIAGYLRRDVTTVQRWEKREGLPVHRHQHDKLASVYAFRSELDAWSSSRRPVAADDASSDAGEAGDHVPRVGPQSAVSPHAPGSSDVEPASPATLAGPADLNRARGPRTRFVAAIFVAVAIGSGTFWWSSLKNRAAWDDPFDKAAFRRVTDFDGIEESAVISPDGRLLAFLSNRDGRVDVWVTQIGSGQFFNLTHGRFADLDNPSIRTLGFTPHGDQVTFWARGAGGTPDDISTWAVPTLGGEPRLYVEGAAEVAWSSDGAHVAYHTAGPGDPTYVTTSIEHRPSVPLFAATPGLHAHFPAWSPDGAFIYFVQGSPTEAADIWRVRASGGIPERITRHDTRVSHPVPLDDRTIAYLATGSDGTGPYLHSIDVDRRVPHRAGLSGLDRYTSLSGSADGQRLVATLADPKVTLWRLTPGARAPEAIRLPTGRGTSPRLGPGYFLYVAAQASGDSVWRVSEGAALELWRDAGARVVGAPDIAPDGRRVVMTVQKAGRTVLYAMHADGTGKRVISHSLALRGTPSWGPDGQSIVSAVEVDGTPRICRIALDGTVTPLVREYSVDPVWSPRGERFLYTGADIGTTFRVAAATVGGEPDRIANITLSRGARRLRLLGDGRTLVALVGGMQHKDLWHIDVQTGLRTQQTHLAPDFVVRDFDVSADGRDVVLERVQEYSDIVMIERATRE